MSPAARAAQSHWLRIGLRVLVFLGLILLAIKAGGWVKDALDISVMPHNEAMLYKALLTALLVYTVLMATPFLPGAEIGLLLLASFGATVAPLVYAATLIGLATTYAIGRLVHPEVTAGVLDRLRLASAAALLRKMAETPQDARLDVLMDQVDAPWLKRSTRFRYIGLALLLNVPGNVVFGGGGGLALVAGLSCIFRPGWTLLTLALAVLPVPFFVFLTGTHP